MNVKSKNIEYLPGIDHLRAFASLLIVLYHGTQMFDWEERTRRGMPRGPWAIAADPFSSLVLEGHTAVGLFMVLSGFIFAYGVGDRDVVYSRFLRNRFLRTYPLFLFLVAVGCCAQPNAVSLQRLLHSVLGLSNFQAHALQVLPFSSMFWTISIEWQFYLVFPFLMKFMRPRMLRNASAFLLLMLIARVLAFANGSDPRELAYWTLLGRIDQFVLGMVGGYYSRSLNPKLLRWMFVPAACCALGSLFFFNRKMGGWPSSTPWKLGWVTWEGAMWAWFTMTYLAVSRFVPARVGAALSAVGTVSYSIYLWHWPLVAIASRKGWMVNLVSNLRQNAFFNTALFVLPVLLGFAFLSYRLIEEPFLRLRVRYVTEPAPPDAA